jgi:CRP-like cAMP-binding protein
MISTVEKVLFLKSIDLFSQIPGEDLSQIALITDEVQFDEGDEIFHEGDPGDTLYFIIDGKVRIATGGEELAQLGERQVFGEMALLDSEPRSASATALSDVTLLKILRDDFHEILAEKAEIAQGIIKVLTRRLRTTNDRRRGAGMHAVPVTDPGIKIARQS